MTVDKKRKFLIDTAFIVLVAVIIYLVFRFCLIYLLPFVIGLLLALIVQRPSEALSKITKIKKGIIALIFVIILFLLVAALIGVLGYFAYGLLEKLVSVIKGSFTSWNDFYTQISTRFVDLFNALPDEVVNALRTLPDTLVQKLTDVIGSIVTFSASTIVKSGPGLIISIIVTVVATCYIAKDYDKVTQLVKAVVSSRTTLIISNVKSIFFDSIFKLLKGYILLMVITFTELSIGLFLLGVKNPVLIAGVIAVVDILPVLGTGAVVIPWAIISLVIGDIWRCVGLLVLYLVITFVRNFLEPKVIGDQIGLHPLLTLISMFVGLRLFGFIGLFMCPIALIIIVALDRRGVINVIPKIHKDSKPE